MKITTFDPIIITRNGDAAVETFEALGFEKTHAPVTDTGHGDVQSYRMKDSNGFHVDVACSISNISQDMTFIRMNVDNFEEAYNILIDHGFRNTRGDKTLDTQSAKAATMVSPSGFTIALVEHIKK